jgi:hypothetical protein
MANSSLAEIQIKTRRITRSPSTAQLSDADLNQYINTYVLYDLPSQLRLFNLRTKLTFYTQPNVDFYPVNTTNTLDPLYNFNNVYIAFHEPVFLAGLQGFYTQFRDVFYGYFPQTNYVEHSPTFADGTMGPFIGTLSERPMLQNYVVFNTLNATGTAMVLVDFPTDNVTGILAQPNDSGTPLGTINYLTGAYTLNFPEATVAGNPIWSDTIPYQSGKPYSILYYNDAFVIRPVPDNVYTVQIEADIRPTELLSTGQSPDLEQWYQLIALGAAIKIFQDRMDYDSANTIFAEYQRQERMALRTTLTQQVNMRTQTIFIANQWGINGWGLFGNWPY